MSQPPIDRRYAGRNVLTTMPRLKETLKSFYQWLAVAAEKCAADNVVIPAFEEGKLTSVAHPLGVFDVHEDVSMVDDKLCIQIILFKPVSALRKDALPFYVIRVHDDAVFFGPPASSAFEIDPNTGSWSHRNILQLGYELALAATEPAQAIRIKV